MMIHFYLFCKIVDLLPIALMSKSFVNNSYQINILLFIYHVDPVVKLKKRTDHKA